MPTRMNAIHVRRSVGQRLPRMNMTTFRPMAAIRQRMNATCAGVNCSTPTRISRNDDPQMAATSQKLNHATVFIDKPFCCVGDVYFPSKRLYGTVPIQDNLSNQSGE